jgi:hypothetical protein
MVTDGACWHMTILTIRASPSQGRRRCPFLPIALRPPKTTLHR